MSGPNFAVHTVQLDHSWIAFPKHCTRGKNVQFKYFSSLHVWQTILVKLSKSGLKNANICFTLAGLFTYIYTYIYCTSLFGEYWLSSFLHVYRPRAQLDPIACQKRTRSIFPQYGPRVCSVTNTLPACVSTRNLTHPRAAFNVNFLNHRLLLKFVVSLRIPSQGMER